MTRSRLVLAGVGVLVLSFVVGWLLGRSGRAELENTAAENHMLLQIQTGAARVLEARVSLYNNNFCDASRHLERAKPMFEGARDRLNATNRQADAAVLDRVAAIIADAQRMAGALDTGANTKAGEALAALREINLPEPEAIQAPAGQ